MELPNPPALSRGIRDAAAWLQELMTEHPTMNHVHFNNGYHGYQSAVFRLH
jgi:hypothetical protein